MKKLCAIVLAVLAIALSLTLTGCEQPQVTVESTMKISSAFKGERTVTVVFPLSYDIDSVKDEIIEKAPDNAEKGVSFDYLGVGENGYSFRLTIDFSSKDAYLDALNALIGYRPAVFLSKKNTALTRGVRMTEDFSAANLLSWMTDTVDSHGGGLNFNYDLNTVTVDGESFLTAPATDIDSREGGEVTEISIATTNSKSELYDRTITFTVPNTTYNAAKAAIEEYFLTNTAPEARYYGWTAKGTNMEYTVIFNGVDIAALCDYTAMLLDTTDAAVFYGDKDNSSTPLSEGLTFEETIDTFSFIGADGGAAKLSYSYALPTRTTHGDGALKAGSSWRSEGSWEDGVYFAEFSDDAFTLRIPDGIQYTIEGINFSLTSLGDSRFRRTTDFLYSTADGYDGRNYAADFFRLRGADVALSETDNALVCSVSAEGSPGEITDSLVKCFGSGNFMTYSQNTGAFALSTKTEFTDYVNLGYMLNASNIGVPMIYTVSSEGDENIVSLAMENDEVKYTEKDSELLQVAVESGNGAVTYRGNIPIFSRIIIYGVIGALLVILTVLTVFMLLKKNHARIKEENRAFISDPEPEDEPDGAENTDGGTDGTPSLAQTTTFSILELGALTRNKKYVDEINRDIEERLEKDRLETMKREIRAEELAQMERMVYGTISNAAEADETAAESSAEPTAENAESPKNEEQSS